jgi:hypothetical protein
VADGGHGPLPLDSAGHTFGGFPKTSGRSWGSIWARAAEVRPEARALGAEYWVYSANMPSNLVPKNRGLLVLGGNVGITFDLAAIRRIQGDQALTRFHATAATCGGYIGDLWVFIDGHPEWKALGMTPKSGVRAVDVSIGPADRFLTLAATVSGDRAVRGGAAFGDPVLEPASSEREAPAAPPTVAVAPSTSTIYAENFEGMSAGPLCGQGGWAAGFHTGVINVGTGGRLGNMQVLAVRTGSGIPDAAHSLGSLARLDSSQVTTLQWDAEHGGNNSAFGFSSMAGPDGDFLGCWCSSRTGWVLDPFGLTSALDDRVRVSGGTGGVVHLKLVIDGPARTLAGYYDFGGGWTQAGRYTISLGQIERITHLYLVEDYRDWSGGSGVGVDNILLNSSVAPRPVRVYSDIK